MDRLQALEVFVAIAEAGSLAGAGRRLSLSAPSVTRVLSDLETSLGGPLFHRTTRALTLTDTGRNFLESARQIVTDYAEATDAARGAHRAPTGLLRVTAPVLFGQHYISPILLAFLDLYPNVQIEAVYLDRVVNLIEEGFDVAVRIGPLPESGLVAARAGAVQRVVCGCPAYFTRYGRPQTPADLGPHRIIGARPVTPTALWRFADGIEATVRPRLWFTSVAAAIEATKTSWGLTRVLSYQIGPELGTGDLETVLRDYEPASLPIHLVHAEGRSASAKVRSFVDLAVACLRRNPYLNG